MSGSDVMLETSEQKRLIVQFSVTVNKPHLKLQMCVVMKVKIVYVMVLSIL
jgi:hypothetical protein